MSVENKLPSRLSGTRHPLLYEVNTRVLIRELSRRERSRVTLSNIPDDIIDGWAGFGFDAVWLMGVWRTGPLGRDIALGDPHLRNEYRLALPDWGADDVGGSPYSIQDYTVSIDLDGNEGLASLRKRLAERGVGLILDFVANHAARDGSWVAGHPEYFISGSPGDDVARPDVYFKAKTNHGDLVLAHGKDPGFPGWTDTAQLDIRSPETRRALTHQLLLIAEMCDGVRCDMAMLLLNDVFARTWHGSAPPEGEVDGEFWEEAISGVRQKHPDFLFVAEAYWNREWDLQRLGFNYTYDKVLYDRLLREGASSARDHLKAAIGYQMRSVRFLENHDEHRAARVLHSEDWHSAAAVIVSTVPGMVLVHDGQLDGRTTKLPIQLLRRPEDPGSDNIRSFYRRLLTCLAHPVFREGEWTILPARPSWHDNSTWENFFVFFWHHERHGTRMVVVNYAPRSGQCYTSFPGEPFGDKSVEFRDLMGQAVYVRDAGALASKGMYFDLPPYGIHVFEVKPVGK
ncbi:MAG: alpha-amylase family glycosyl hydrolase [Bacteroidota bacterium]